MKQIGSIIADTATVGVRMAGRLTRDVPAERFDRLARVGDQTIQSNHPAFVLGHLCLYPAEVLELLGQDPAALQPPRGFETVFSKDAQCEDDADGTLYPPSDEIVDFFNRSYETAQEAVRAASDTQLTADNPQENPIQQFCPTLASLLNFYMVGHITVHLGQISAWRRREGMQPA